MPDDGKPQHQLPLTPAGRDALNRTKPASGLRGTVPADNNDPVLVFGDPQGFPREDLYELRAVQILQTPQSVVLLYQFGKIWRVIWTDGREIPKDPEPRWFGYSVGKWVDDYTLVVETSGLDERTWVDKAGRPELVAAITISAPSTASRPDATGLTDTRSFSSFRYRARSWSRQRRICYKAEHTALGTNLRFVIANCSGRAAEVFSFYNDRGESENRIEEFKNGFRPDRLSCQRFLANAFRLLLHAIAYNLVNLFRLRQLPEPWRSTQIETLRARLFKIGARIRQTTRCIA